jgi:hypothetical protein
MQCERNRAIAGPARTNSAIEMSRLGLPSLTRPSILLGKTITPAHDGLAISG